MHWLKHAFAIEAAESFQPTEPQRALVDRLCREIISRGLTTPALLFLESARPLNYLTAQGMTFFSPLVSLLGSEAACKEVATFLEHRGSVEYFARTLEAMAATPPASGAAAQ